MATSVDRIFVSKDKLDRMADNFIEVHKLEEKPTLEEMIVLAGNSGIGTVTKDATATSSDILEGKTAYVADGKTTGTIKTYDGANEGGEVGEAEVVTPLFAPTLNASAKSLSISDTRNGDFANTYKCYLNNQYIEAISGSLDVTPYLTGDKDSYKFDARASGLLLDSPKSNDINYYKVLFKNQDDSLLHTQIELAGETFRYEGFEPTSSLGNFYGWNESKDGTIRQLEFNIDEPKVYYALYTSEFADSLVLVGEYEELTGATIYSVQIDNKAYVLCNNKIYVFNPSDNSLTDLGVTFTTRRAVAYDGKIYTQEKLASTTNLYVFNTATNSIEDTIVLNITNDIEGFVIYNNKLYFANTSSQTSLLYNYNLYAYDLSTSTLETVYTGTIDRYGYNKIPVFIDNYLYYVGTSSVVKIDIANLTMETVLQFVNQNSYSADKVSKAFIGNKLYAFGSGVGAYGEYYEIRQLDFENNTTHNNVTYKGTVTVMQSELLKYGGNIDKFLSAVTIGSTVYLFGFGAVQKYY